MWHVPMLRYLPSFDSVPANITAENLRYYKINNLVQTFGWMVHLTWVFLFLLIGNQFMTVINVFSVLIYIMNIWLNRRGHHFISSSIMVLEILLHQLIAVPAFGWEAGFQYYVIIISMLPFLMPPGQWWLKGIILHSCICGFIYLDYQYHDVVPKFALTMSWHLY